MDPAIKTAIFQALESEPFSLLMKMKLVKLESGYSAVEMVYQPEKMDNIYSRAHGGAIYGLIDEAFETAGQTEGTVAVAMNVNVTYVSSPEPGTRLRAEARRISQTKRTACYDIRVTDPDNRIIATCQALAYRTGKPIPFLKKA
ncbi:MAG: PaaI family thioesterase [Thermodesulfobacteriota bacterium]